MIMLSFAVLLYLIELVNAAVFDNGLDHFGIVSRHLSGLPGVAWAPLLHASWQHLFGNTIPLMVFGFLAMSAGLGPWIASTVTIWLVSGIGVWLIGPSAPTVTVGASGLAFGWLAFLLVRGIFNRGVGQTLVALVLLVLWGGVLLGLLPGNPGISWQAHVFGALGGILAAWLTVKANRGHSSPKGARGGHPGNLTA